MTTTTDYPLASTRARNDHDDGFQHIVCCDDDKALCGKDVSAVSFMPRGTEPDCLVCADLEDLTCPRCGQ